MTAEASSGRAGGPAKDAPAQIAVRSEWLALHREDILDPDRPIIDAHHHLWDPPGARYLFDAYLADLCSGHRIVASVAVEGHGMHRAGGPPALRPVGETEFLAGVAAQGESGRYGAARPCAAIVGFADLTLGDHVAPVLEAHVAAGGGRFRGIRGRTSAHADAGINRWGTPEGLLRTPAVRAAARAIARAGLSLDVWIYQTQIDELVDLCRHVPELTVVVNHCGGPLGCDPYRTRHGEMFAAWSEGIGALAALPNTAMKLGGLGLRFAGHDFHLAPRPPSSETVAAAWGPHIERCIDAFGPARCLFASNFPADKGMVAYPVLWNAFKRIARGASGTDRDALFHDTAARLYRIPRQDPDA